MNTPYVPRLGDLVEVIKGDRSGWIGRVYGLGPGRCVLRNWLRYKTGSFQASGFSEDFSNLKPLNRTITPREAAQALGLKAPTIIKYIEQGRLPAVRQGRRWHIPLGALVNSGIEFRLLQAVAARPV